MEVGPQVKLLGVKLFLRSLNSDISGSNYYQNRPLDISDNISYVLGYLRDTSNYKSHPRSHNKICTNLINDFKFDPKVIELFSKL